jgi:hypothetical protein
MQFLSNDMLLRLVLYPSAMLGAIASCWLILRPLLRRGTQKAHAEANKLAAHAISSQQIAERLKRNRS